MPSAKLKDRSVLSVTGDDASGFLQNIVTCDMESVDRSGIGYGALLTPQGKIICDFLIFRAPNGYRIDVRQEAENTLAGRFQLYKLRADIAVSMEPDLAVYVSWGEDLLENGVVDPRLAELGHRHIAPASGADSPDNENEWQRHRIELAIPEGGIDFSFNEAFPYDAAMDCLNGVAFEKGCYVGQEVVSRMRHRGTARRRIVAVNGESDLPDVGTDLTAEGKPLGQLGSSAGPRGIGLVRLDRAAKAKRIGSQIHAGPVAVTLEIPDWADYGWPPEAGGS